MDHLKKHKKSDIKSISTVLYSKYSTIQYSILQYGTVPENSQRYLSNYLWEIPLLLGLATKEV